MMSEATEILEEEQSNPYNMRKPWHKPDGKRMPQADELYYDEEEEPAQKATRSQKKAAPASKETNYKKRYDVINLLEFVLVVPLPKYENHLNLE